MVFRLCMWNLDHKEGWGPKNGCFWIVVLEMTLESPLDSKEIKPVNPKRNQPWILEGLMLKFQYFGHLMWRADSLGKTLMLGGIEGGRRRGDRGWDGWMASLTQRTWVWVSSGSGWWTGRPGVLQSMGLQRVGYDWATELNWTELMLGSGGKWLTPWGGTGIEVWPATWDVSQVLSGLGRQTWGDTGPKSSYLRPPAAFACDWTATTSAPAETEPCDGAAADLPPPPQGNSGGVWGTLCSRKLGGQVFR